MTAKNIVLALGDDRLNLALQSLAMRLEANRADRRLLRSIGYGNVAERL